MRKEIYEKVTVDIRYQEYKTKTQMWNKSIMKSDSED